MAFSLGAQTTDTSCCDWICTFGSQEQCNDCLAAGCDATPTPTATPTRTPPGPTPTPTAATDPGYYEIPPAVGVTQHAYELEPIRPEVTAHWSTAELMDDVALHGYWAIRLHYMGNPFDGMGPWEWKPTSYDPPPLTMNDIGAEFMGQVYTHDGIELVIVRFTSQAWSMAEAGCNDIPVGTTFVDQPYYALAWYLFEWFGDQNKTIWLADWEGDWQIRGFRCDEYNDDGTHKFPFRDTGPWAERCAEECAGDIDCVNGCGDAVWDQRARFIKEQIKRRQRAVRAAREAFPDAILRVEHVEIGNFYPVRSSRPGPTMAELVGELDRNDKPDRFGLSFWFESRISADPAALLNTLTWIEQTTGLPRNRIYLDELGTNNDENADRIYNLGVAALDWGVAGVMVFDWKRTWCDPDYHFGMWDQCRPCEGKVTWCGENARYYAARRLQGYVRTPTPTPTPTSPPLPRRPRDRPNIHKPLERWP